MFATTGEKKTILKKRKPQTGFLLSCVHTYSESFDLKVVLKLGWSVDCKCIRV